MVNATLNKDVQLTYVGHGKYDIVMTNDDFLVVDDLQSLRMGILIALMTRWNELKNNPTYGNGFGNKAYAYIKQNKTVMVKTAIKEELIRCVTRIRRVASVNYLDISNEDDETLLYSIGVITITGEQIEESGSL